MVSTGNQKAGWLAPSILSAHPSYPPRERKKHCAIYFSRLGRTWEGEIINLKKHCAIYPPLKWGWKSVRRCHLLALPFFPNCASYFDPGVNDIKTLTLKIINKSIGHWNRQNYKFSCKTNEIELNEK